MNEDTIVLGKVTYNANWLRTVTEEKAVRMLSNKKHSQVRNAWKQANGKSVKNYTKKDDNTKND